MEASEPSLSVFGNALKDAASTQQQQRPSWVAIAAVMLSVMMPVCGWMVSLSNRVAVLESDNSHLSTAAVEIAALKQRLVDFQDEYERDRINDRVNTTRQP